MSKNTFVSGYNHRALGFGEPQGGVGVGGGGGATFTQEQKLWHLTLVFPPLLNSKHMVDIFKYEDKATL